MLRFAAPFGPHAPACAALSRRIVAVTWLENLIALVLTLTSCAVGLAAGRWWRLVRGFNLADVNRVVLTITQGLVLLAILGGLDQRPLARALAFAAPMALAWGLLGALAPSGEPIGRWWQLWRWRIAPPKQ
jgi:hypothetical protein